MSTRTIKLKLLTKLALETVETSARTFGELKAEIASLGIDWNSSKLIDRASKASFEMDDSVLPATDAIMFVMPTKSKAGAGLEYKDVKAKIKAFRANGGNVPFNYTQATTQQLNSFWDTVEAQAQVVNEIQEEDDEELPVITLEPGVYKVVVNGSKPVILEYVDETTLEDLDVEAQELK